MVAHDCNLALLVPALALAALASKNLFLKIKVVKFQLVNTQILRIFRRFATDLGNPFHHQLHALADNCFACTGTKKRLQITQFFGQFQDSRIVGQRYLLEFLVVTN